MGIMIPNKLKSFFPRHAGGWVITILIFSLCSCFNTRPSPIPGFPPPYKVLGKWYQPIPHAKGFSEKGTASWYGKKFHGRKTANGETYDMYSMTAAHKTIPLGTWLSVENLENGKSVEVRVNDRGPFVKGRIIDLSYKAAAAINMTGKGTARVKITAIPDKKIDSRDKTETAYSIQVGSFSNRENAEAFMKSLEKSYKNVHIASINGKFKVRIGKFTSPTELDEVKTELKNSGFPAFTVKE